MPESSVTPAAVLVLGLGNVSLGDEGFGVHVARRLKQSVFPSNIRIEAGGVAGFDLLGLLAGVDEVIVIDVMVSDLPPGEIGFYELDDSFNAAGKTNLSFHQVGIVELFQIAELSGWKPRVRFLVTRPEKLEWSFDLSPAVQQAADKAVDFLENLLTDKSPAETGTRHIS